MFENCRLQVDVLGICCKKFNILSAEIEIKGKIVVDINNASGKCKGGSYALLLTNWVLYVWGQGRAMERLALIDLKENNLIRE